MISQSFLSLAPQIKFENSYRSDHSPVVLIFKTNEFKRGKGFWKFNNSLLTDKDYVKLIKEKICEVKLQYACLVYNRELIPEIDNDIISFTINDQIFLDILLMEIRGKTISYSTFKKKNASKRESQLEKEILILEQNLGEQSLPDITSKQNELENIRKERLKGQCLRSRSKWIEEGEKPSKYFTSLESKNFINKQIPKLVQEDETIIYDQDEILNETKNFYEKLYSKKTQEAGENFVKEKINQFDFPKLDTKELQYIEGPLIKTEVSNFLKKMKNDKSPGPDGFSSEFLKKFLERLGFLYNTGNK